MYTTHVGTGLLVIRLFTMYRCSYICQPTTGICQVLHMVKIAHGVTWPDRTDHTDPDTKNLTDRTQVACTNHTYPDISNGTARAQKTGTDHAKNTDLYLESVCAGSR